jgi:ribonuclease HI
LFEGRAGFGVFSEELDLKASFALETFATVFQPEVYAIYADYCLRECMTGKTICICSNSRAALFALSLHTVSHRGWCFSAGTLCRVHNRVQLFWVPGHCGVIGNEEANGLAGVGSKSSFCGLEPCLPVPKSLMTRVTKEWLSSYHLSYWNMVSRCRQSKVWIKRPCFKMGREIYQEQNLVF